MTVAWKAPMRFAGTCIISHCGNVERTTTKQLQERNISDIIIISIWKTVPLFAKIKGRKEAYIMFKKMPVCRLMISCPSDVKTEIEIINKVVDNINDSIGMSMDIFVKTLHWSRNVMPEAGDFPQSIINKQILDKSDAIIAIFGNKIGSPTQYYESGTVEEIEEMIKEGKQVFVFFSDKPIRRSERNEKEEKKVEAFKRKYRNRGIYVEYGSDEEFSEIITRNLTRYLTTELANEANRIDEHTRFDNAITHKEEVDLLNDYTQFCEIKSVTSYSDPNIMKIVTHKNCFNMEIEFCNVEKTEKQEFAMAVFEYAPCDNWSGFFEAGYLLEFDAVSVGSIKAFQLEIKDDIRNKIIDKTMNVNENGKHFQIWLPSTTRDLTSWRKISQVCFTIFFNKAYISGEKGILTIEKLKMIPSK